MIQFFGRMKDGSFRMESALGAAAFPSALLDQAELAWLDISNPGPNDLSWLGAKFHFHPLALEDCTHFDQRPKIEQYADQLFVVVHGLHRTGGKALDVYELHCFITKDSIVTVHEGEIEPLVQFRNRLGRDSSSFPLQTDFLLHRILDVVMDANPGALRGIEEEIEQLDVQVLEQTQTLHIEKILDLQKQLNAARYVFAPQREIFGWLAGRKYPQISEKAALYYRDIYDHLVRVLQNVEELRESLWAIRDAHLSMAAYRTNEAMKRLTIFSVVFLPLTFITGFFGMNFEHMPWKNDALLMFTVGTIVLLPLVMLLWFNRKNWF